MQTGNANTFDNSIRRLGYENKNKKDIQANLFESDKE